MMSTPNAIQFTDPQDRFLALLPSISDSDKEKILNIERLRHETIQDLYIVAGQIYSLSTHPIDSWTLFQWMQSNGIPSRYIIYKENEFYQAIKKKELTKDVVAVDTDCLHNELLDLTEELVRAKAFIVEWRTDSIVDVWLQHLVGCRYVFLQHGIIGTYVTDALRKVFAEEYNDINVSSEHEIALTTTNQESKQKCFIAGLPRFDLLVNSTGNTNKKEKTVFVMPTWRNHLKENKDTFYKSIYYKGLAELFSPENIAKLKQKNIRFVFAAHHMMIDNLGALELPSNVDIVNSQEGISYWTRNADAFVTDFSSAAFDFLFQNKPVIFWIPDKNDYQEPQYSQDADKINSALKQQKNFFNLADTSEDVIHLLLQYAETDFLLGEDYQKKISKYFCYREHFCERVYNNINARIEQEQTENSPLFAAKGANGPKVSIIIPAYNVEKYLTNCLDSIIVQTYGNFEAIIVNDGSTDCTKDICDLYVYKDPRIKVIHQPNSGVSVARNSGLKVARGEYITFIDADDWVSPDYLSVIVHTRPECDLLFFGNTHHHQDGTCHAYSPGNRLAYEQIDREDLLMKMSQNDCWYEFFGYTWNKRFKNSIIKQHKVAFLPQLSLREDELFTECYTRHINSVACTNHCIYHYRFSYGGLTYRFHPGQEVLALARGLNNATNGIQHQRMLSLKKSKVFHYLFTATLNLHTKESLAVFSDLYALYHTYHRQLTDNWNPFLDKRTRKRYQRIFAHNEWLSRLWFLFKRKKMKKTYHGV